MYFGLGLGLEAQAICFQDFARLSSTGLELLLFVLVHEGNVRRELRLGAAYHMKQYLK